MASQKQIEANRKNAQRSTGPRSDAGKAAARLNAIRHGLRAEVITVLPGEDPEAFRARLDAWLTDYRPRDTVEEELVRHAAHVSWKIGRARRHETAALTRRVREAAEQVRRDQLQKLEAAANALVPDPNALSGGSDRGEVAEARRELESTVAGCEILLRRWAPLLAKARAGERWDQIQEMTAIRLMARGPIGTVHDPEILDVAAADRMLAYPDAPLSPATWFDGPGRSFARQAVAEACLRLPGTLDGARKVLLDVATRETERLQALIDG